MCELLRGTDNWIHMTLIATIASQKCELQKRNDNRIHTTPVKSYKIQMQIACIKMLWINIKLKYKFNQTLTKLYWTPLRSMLVLSLLYTMVRMLSSLIVSTLQGLYIGLSTWVPAFPSNFKHPRACSYWACSNEGVRIDNRNLNFVFINLQLFSHLLGTSVIFCFR